ncbi:MAG: ChbG/HpnK family deacetylase [Bacteroidetes bacterium]|nr:ChbG/HpnK family deacetylase [Bacteroidota bacterium]
MRYLIINADDFGYSKIFNPEILRLLKNGFIYSTTVMINWVNDEQDAQVKELIELNQSHNISVGLHLEFNDTNFLPEIKRQHELFVKTFGFEPSHIDLHKSTYLNEVDEIITKYCNENNFPRRNHRNGKAKSDITTNTAALSGSNISFDELKSTAADFKDGECYEILFHPGKYDPNCKSSLNKQREDDVKKIEEINPFLKENNIKLVSFHDLANLL